MTLTENCDSLIYGVSDVTEGLQLLADGAPDPDPDRRADLVRVFRTLRDQDRYALMMRFWGHSDQDIATRLLGEGKHSKQGARLVARALSVLRRGMNDV